MGMLKQSKSLALLFLAAFCIVGFSLGSLAEANSQSKIQNRLVSQEVSGDHQFLGLKGCAGASCHSAEKNGDQIKWFRSDKHGQAFNELYEDLAYSIGEKLEIEEPSESETCLSCHSTGKRFESARFHEDFLADDGVSCESCHGAGEKYLEFHHKEGMRAQANEAGQLDVWDLKVQAQNCLVCHTAVDTKLFAAGHPMDFNFDLRKRRKDMKHWETGQPLHEKRAFAIGRLLLLKRLLERHINLGTEEGKDFKTKLSESIQSNLLEVSPWFENEKLKALQEQESFSKDDLLLVDTLVDTISTWDDASIDKKIEQ